MKYAGIGSKKTPGDILSVMTYLGTSFALKGFTLRSGRAVGADQAFEKGAIYAGAFANGLLDLFVAQNVPALSPWYGHAQSFHPAWRLCSESARALHARNSPIMLGANLDDPVDFVVCWTRGGKPIGGTGQALRIAAAYKIPVFNLYDDPQGYAIFRWLKGNANYHE